MTMNRRRRMNHKTRHFFPVTVIISHRVELKEEKNTIFPKNVAYYFVTLFVSNAENQLVMVVE